jgi:hypothetical protein
MWEFCLIELLTYKYYPWHFIDIRSHCSVNFEKKKFSSSFVTCMVLLEMISQE